MRPTRSRRRPPPSAIGSAAAPRAAWRAPRATARSSCGYSPGLAIPYSRVQIDAGPEESSLSLIEVTEPAAERIRQLLGKEGKLASHALRMKVVGGGCSGLRYELAFDDRVGEGDTELEAHGVRLLVDEKSALYLVGTTLDFVDTLNETGFKMRNPNATTTCGCGESFGA